MLRKVFSCGNLIFADRIEPMIRLLQTSITTSDASSYLPIGIQVLIAVGLVAFLMFATHMLGPKRKTSDKLQNFSSGIESHGDARQPIAIKYFLTAILFVPVLSMLF